ncbi:MAG: protein kinase domain-containing protein [Trebonia sp.]
MTERPALPERYQLIGKIGRGGMGDVWLAHDSWLKREVALKQLITSNDDTADLARRRRRVLHEARALAKVKHPAIVPIHDFFLVKRDPWIVMEYIKGEPLDKIIGRERLSERLVARIGLRVLNGLVAAHNEGIVHRDVKPGNILVTADGAVFLIDFGIARSASDPSLTGGLSILGTLEYLAPERLEAGAEAGPPSDIWSLGVTLFHALEGYSPFRHGQPDTQSIMTAILRDTPTPARRCPLADITLRMLDKDPARRAAAPEVRRVLERVANGQSQPSHQSWRPASKPATEQNPPPGPGPVPAGLEEEIVRAGVDKGASMLVSLDVPAAARIVADCPAKERGALLQGIAVVEPATAATILRMLLADAAGPAFGGLSPKTAASLLAALPVPEAARILGCADTRAAADAITEVPPSQAAAQLKSMADRKRAAEVLAHALSGTVTAIAGADRDFARLVLPYLNEPLRSKVSDAITG